MYDQEQDPMYRRKKQTEKEQFEQFELPAILEERRQKKLEEMRKSMACEGEDTNEFRDMLPDEFLEECRANGHKI